MPDVVSVPGIVSVWFILKNKIKKRLKYLGNCCRLDVACINFAVKYLNVLYVKKLASVFQRTKG